MDSTDYLKSYNLSPQFMDSKLGYFNSGEEIKVEDDAENIYSKQQFFQNSYPWNPIAAGHSEASQMSPGNFANVGYHSFEDIVSKILEEEPPELKVENADAFGKMGRDKISNENNNHGVFFPLNNNLFNYNGSLADNDLSQAVMSTNLMNQSNDYNNCLIPPKMNVTNQVEKPNFNQQQPLNSLNNSNVNYLNNYFLALQNAFLTNPELFKSTMNPSFKNIPQFNILENLLNANGMKNHMNYNGFNQVNRQASMSFQNQKNLFFPGNSYRLNVPTYKQPSTFTQSQQFTMDSMMSNFNLNQHNQQLFNNSMHYKNQMDLKVTKNLTNHSVMLYMDLCFEQLSFLSTEEQKMSCELGGNINGERKSVKSAVAKHMKLNVFITESFSLHYRISVLLKELLRNGEGRFEKEIQVALNTWLEMLTRLQNKYKEELIGNVNRPAALSYNDGGADTGSCLQEMHERLRRVRTALWCVRETACNHVSNIPTFF